MNRECEGMVTMGADVPVEVAAVLEDLAAERAPVHPLLLPGLGPPQDGHAVRAHHQAVPPRLRGLSPGGRR